MVVVRAYHYVFITKQRIRSLHDTYDILRVDVSFRQLDGEILTQGIGEHQHTGLLQRFVQIGGGSPLSLAAGKATFKRLVAECLDVLTQRGGNSKILCGKTCRTEF